MAMKGGWEERMGGSGEGLLKREETINLDGSSVIIGSKSMINHPSRHDICS